MKKSLFKRIFGYGERDKKRRTNPLDLIRRRIMAPVVMERGAQNIERLMERGRIAHGQPYKDVVKLYERIRHATGASR